MIVAVQTLFGDTSEAQITKPFIITQLNAGQIDIARKTKCLPARKETDTVIGQSDYEVPDDFIQIESVEIEGRTIPHLSMQTLDEYDRTRSQNGNGSVRSYFTKGRTIFLSPPPNKAIVKGLDIWYLKRPKDLTDDNQISDLPVTMHDDVVLFALTRCKELDEEFEQAMSIKRDYFERINEGKDEIYDEYADSYPSVRLLPGDY